MRRFLLFAAFIPFLALAYVSPGKPLALVSDFAGVLSLEDKANLEAKLQGIKNATGAEISVVLVKSLGGDTVENYANSLFNEWGIGQKEKNNGILFLAAIDDREMRIEIGYGLEGDLTDAQSYWIEQNEIVPAFKNGDYAGGINAGIDKISAAVGGTEQIPSLEPNQPPGFRFNGDYVFLFIFIPIWLVSILGRSKSWWLGGVLGGIAGIVIVVFFGFIFVGLISIAGLTALGLVFDYFVSKAYQKGKTTGHFPWWIGGGRGDSPRGGPFGGGFGGFGGGSSGGGGSSSRW
ncbi:MAG: hypothetical protein UY23_C0003G0031 [Candidatus Jorgensenbacteria bacterium GW2011_GWA1_48_11]|uniref:TPM domain-containing protein n=1 Tax=Candidatus Jorgensenbacteria bacterium GW2011_GWA1_48_11 TaxID=1618660 RepID=A0A0G1WLI9_9BACT|nr:MAG: hypothetical protein UY23_C0003G0031 [Candidatus Jorgensenbacteria bacterium GW2011_GWA1_48_11]KKW11870.1 MAG: hypothetical protein UY51_C0005G0111 [Candidatus Jorgensenbacteria bacterium GW2011_GWB1_49_9]